MGIRERLNHPASVVVVVVLFLLTLFLIWIGRDKESAAQTFINKSYFSADDGATFFVDDANKVPPFDHNGKPAYRCMVYSKDGGKTLFVGYLLRYSPDAKAKFEAALKSNDPGKSMHEGTILAASAEVKAPGQSEWVSATSPAAAAIMNPAGDPEPVLPQ